MELISSIRQYECPVCQWRISEPALNRLHQCTLEVEDIMAGTGETINKRIITKDIPRRMEDYLTIRCTQCGQVVVLTPSKMY